MGSTRSRMPTIVSRWSGRRSSFKRRLGRLLMSLFAEKGPCRAVTKSRYGVVYGHAVFSRVVSVNGAGVAACLRRVVITARASVLITGPITANCGPNSPPDRMRR